MIERETLEKETSLSLRVQLRTKKDILEYINIIRKVSCPYDFQNKPLNDLFNGLIKRINEDFFWSDVELILKRREEKQDQRGKK